MLHAFVLAVFGLSLVAILGLLGITLLSHEMWIFRASAIYYCLASTTMALILYLYISRQSPHGRPIIRKLSLAGFFLAALPSTLPIGFVIGIGVVLTGVWTDEPGSHADLEILGPIGTAMLGLICGPIIGIIGLLSARRRTR